MQWFPGDVSMAIQVSRKNKALLVVYISADSPDGKIFDEFWQQIDSNNMLCPVVGIKLKEGETAAKQFADIYPTPILPAAYLIDHEGKPIEVITSLVGKTYDAFRARFDRGTASFANAIGKTASSQTIEPQSAPRASEAAPAPPPVETNSAPSSSTTSTQNSSQNGQTMNPDLAEKLARAKKLLELKKHRDAERQREAEKKEREEMAKASEAKRARDDKAIAEAAKLRKKEKEEAQKEKERILAQIKADREDAQKRFNASKMTEPVVKKEAAAETSVGKSIPSDRCRLQVRLPDGSTFVEEFPSNDVLHTLVAIIQQKPSIAGSSFEVHQPYPRRVFTVEDYSKTFLDNQLTPSTALVVVLKPSTASNISKAVSTQSSSLFSLLLSPFLLVWNIFTGMLGFNKPTESSKKNEGTSSSSGAPGASGTQQRGMPRSAQVRRRGNVAGLENPNDNDPEERANFNGNSTQFM